MANKNIPEYQTLASADPTDLLETYDVSAFTNKKVTVAGLSSAVLASAPNNSVTAAMLATNAITLGYAQITSNFPTGSTSPLQVTGLTASVTIPAGGRAIEIEAFTGYLSNSGGNGTNIEIWDGTVGSGTRLQQGYNQISVPGTGYIGNIKARVTPAAGAKTYNVAIYTNSGTITLGAGSTNPAFIQVKVV